MAAGLSFLLGSLLLPFATEQVFSALETAGVTTPRKKKEEDVEQEFEDLLRRQREDESFEIARAIGEQQLEREAIGEIEALQPLVTGAESAVGRVAERRQLEQLLTASDGQDLSLIAAMSQPSAADIIARTPVFR